ncbi:hypothetical protein BH10PSE6_BH10PSE6_27760 [soil metagenome]
MDHTDLFVQAFWVKCREVIRPEIDSTIAGLHSAGHDANVATQEAGDIGDGLPANPGPSITLSMRSSGSSNATTVRRAIEFHGDVTRQQVSVQTFDGHEQSYELAALGPTEVKAEIDAWLARLAISAPV